MNKNFSWITVLIISLTSCLGALYLDRSFFRNQEQPYQSVSERQIDVLGKYFSDTIPAFSANVNFVTATQRVKSSVVYIRSTYDKMPGSMKKFHQNIPDLDDFFSQPGPKNEASGSGVILTDNGFIVTNHHVIQDASTVEVILENKQSFKANVIGSDPTTDLALLKIEAKGLPFIKYGDSDLLQVGEWVLAIGNPFDLTSTVTAGIISGKGRSINILREKTNLAIESFLQTDAAVNPGNSGGALVNLKGELVGINTAIASPTGSFSGYSFAVPSDLVKKVIDDLQKFGMVQRALLGVSILDIDSRLSIELGLKSVEGVYVRDVTEGSAADNAKIKVGDIILEINGRKVNSVPELQEVVGRYRPGEKVKLKIQRGTAINEIVVQLKNQNGDTKVSRLGNTENTISKELEAELASVSSDTKNEFGIKNGVEIKKLLGERLEKVGITEGFIILKMDKIPVSTPAEVIALYKRANGGILLEGINPDGEKQYFALVK